MAFYASVFLWGLSISTYLYFVPSYAVTLGANETFVGVIGSLRALPYSFLPFTFSILSERVGRTRLYVLGVVVTLASTYMFYSSTTLDQVLYSQIVLGVGFALFFPITQSLVKEVSGLARSSVEKQFSVFASSWASAFMLGPYLGGLLSSRLGFKASILTTLAILGLSLALVAFLALRGGELGGRGSGGAGRGALALDARDLRLASPVIIANLVEGFVFSIVVSMVPSLAFRRGLSYEEIGVSYSAMGLSRLSLLLSFSRIYRPAHYRFWVAFSSLLAFASMQLIAYSSSVETLSLALALIGVSMGVFYPSTATLILSYRSSSALMGLYEASLGVGFTLSPVVMGVLIDSIGYTTPYLMASIVCLFMLLGLGARRGG